MSSSRLDELLNDYQVAIDNWMNALSLAHLPNVDRQNAQQMLEAVHGSMIGLYQNIKAEYHDLPTTETPATTSEKPAVAATSDASDHDCGAAHRPVKIPVVSLPPLPLPVPVPVPEPEQEDYARAREWFTKCGYPQAQIDRMIQFWRANDISQEDGRVKDLELGSWATLPNKKRVMVYKWHAFEPPTDRPYFVPGPLKHLGFYDRGDFPGAKGRIVPSNDVPVIPQTRDDYPWWKPAADRVSR
jgi:hypothetical protein